MEEKMNKIIKNIMALVMALLVMALPIVSAQETEIKSNTEASAEITNTKLQFKQFKESMSDFVFKVKTKLTFNQEAKLELLKQRNEILKTRQHEWVELKKQALVQFKSGEFSAEEKQNILANLQQEHQSIIREHIRMTSEIKNKEFEAKSKGDTKIEQKAKETSEAVESSSELSLGLGTDVGINTETQTKINSERAQIIVKDELDLDGSNVKTETKDGVTFFVVTGSEIESKGNVELQKDFEVWVSETGLITSVDYKTHLKAKAVITNELEIKEKSKAKIGVDVSAVI